jgi:hypothetical protein
MIPNRAGTRWVAFAVNIAKLPELLQKPENQQ